jgi:hypothetical protein
MAAAAAAAAAALTLLLAAMTVAAEVVVAAVAVAEELGWSNRLRVSSSLSQCLVHLWLEFTSPRVRNGRVTRICQVVLAGRGDGVRIYTSHPQNDHTNPKAVSLNTLFVVLQWTVLCVVWQPAMPLVLVARSMDGMVARIVAAVLKGGGMPYQLAPNSV